MAGGAAAARNEMVLNQRTLNRALLARQHLLERRRASAAAEIEHLVGMQAQVPNAPYVGIWTRLQGFDPDQLSDLITARRAVRLAVMRNTVHLVTARDCLRICRLFQPMLERQFRSSVFARQLAGIDTRSVVARATALMKEKPRSLAELGALLKQRWPDSDATSLGQAIRHLLPLVQVPPRGVWGKSARPTCTTAQLWLGKPLDRRPSLDGLIRRYLAAFGPATVADISSWSGLAGLRQVVDRLRPSLRTFRDERGRELFDVPDGPLPDPSTPAPPRYLPEYDNVLLGHADRTRVIAFEHRHAIVSGTFLLDGFVTGVWSIKEEQKQAVLAVSPFKPLKRAERTALAEEGERLLDFVAPRAAARDVRLA